MARVVIYQQKLDAMLDSPQVKKHMHGVGVELVGIAQSIFLADRVLEEHNDYVNSYVVEQSGRSTYVGNDDDTSFWVEFGAHAGGKTAVLGYAPLRRSIDVASAG